MNSVRELKEKLQQSKGANSNIRKKLLDKIAEENERTLWHNTNMSR